MENKIRIVHFIYDSPMNTWSNGGGAYRTIEIYKRFPNKFDITVVSGNHKNKKFFHKKIHFFYTGNSKNYFISRFTYTLKSLKFLKKNHKNFDIVVEDFSPYSPLLTFRYKNSILLLQNYFGINSIKKFFFVGILFFLLEKLLLRFYKNIIFSSKFLFNQVKKNINSKAIHSIIPYGINNDLFSLKIREKDYILFLGRIEIYQKGLDILIKTMKLPELQDITLIIAGSGKDENKLKQMIRNLSNIQFIGYVADKKKYNILKNCKFVVMPSRYESFGIVAIEASAVKKPVIGVKKTGLEATIIHNKTGILMNKLTTINLKNSILQLWYNHSLRNFFGKNGYKFAKKFKWDTIAEMQLKFILHFFETKFGDRKS